jgi:hypothetical protein
MYAGFFVFVMGTPLLLGSWYGVLGGLIFVGEHKALDHDSITYLL